MDQAILQVCGCCVVFCILHKVDEGKGKGKGKTEAAAVIKVSHISNCDPTIWLTGHNQKSSSCETNGLYYACSSSP